MNVLLIGHESELNGASRSLLDISDQLIARGHKVFILSSFDSGTFYNEMRKRDVGVLIFPFYRWSNVIYGKRDYLKWFFKYRKANKTIAKRISGIAVEKKIDIIHTNTSVENIGALISSYTGIPHIWHIREFGDLDFNMHFYEPIGWVARFMNKNTERFICVSRSVADHYPFLEKSKKVVIYNGIPNEAVITETEKADNSCVNLLLAGRISTTKGQHEAIAACEQLLKRGISEFELFLAGAGNLNCDVSQELKKHLHILGQVDSMRDIRKRIDVELVCSKAEAFGRVTAEAMLAGNPVIGSNSGGTPELICDGVDGFLYEKGNIDMLAERIAMLIKDRKLCKKMGCMAREKAKRAFLIERCVDQIEEVYSEVLS